MKICLMSVLFVAIFICYGHTTSYQSNTDSTDTQIEALRIYIDCDECDFSFIRMNIPYVNYARDPQTAQVHIKVTNQNTGSGGRKYILNFFGQKNFKNINQKLEYLSSQIDSKDKDRKGITKTIEMGLVTYLSQTPLAPSVKLEFDQNNNIQSRLNDDPWNDWTFHIDFLGDYEAEKSQNELKLTTGLRANHTTEDWKVRTRVKYDHEKEQIEDDGEIVNSILRELESDLKIVKSIDEKWSLGFNSGINHTTFRNIDFAISFAPAIEYNFVPWTMSDQIIVALGYNIGVRKFDYIEKTIFGKNSETVFFEGMALQLEVVKPLWEIQADLKASHFFHDFDKNKIELDTQISLKIIKGFSVKMALKTERPRDQIYLPEEGATREEILLKRKKLATDYELVWSFGLQYSFGSIYNNFVNRRM